MGMLFLIGFAVLVVGVLYVVLVLPMLSHRTPRDREIDRQGERKETDRSYAPPS